MSAIETITPVEELLSGWIERKDGVYVSKYLESTFGWEKEIDIEELPFISALVRHLELDKYYSVEEVVKTKAFAFARHTLQSIGVNTRKHRLHLTEEVGSFTDGKTIVVSTQPLTSKLYAEGDLAGLDVFIGLALHEGCHILYTDFKEYKDFMVGNGIERNKLYRNILNIVEDERIERELLKTYPGNGNFLARLKEFYFSLSREKIELKEEKSLTDFMNIFLQLVRYPRYIQDEHVNRYSDLLFDVKHDLVPFPETMEDCLFASYKILEKILKYFEIEVDETLDKGEISKDAEGGIKGGSAEDVERGIEDELREFEDGSKGLVKEVDEDTATSSDETGEIEGEGKDHYEKILDGEYHYTEEGVKVIVPKGQMHDYLAQVEPLKKYIPGFRHFLHYNTYKRNRDLVGLRNGNLDTNKLAEGFQGSSTIYRQKIKATKAKLTVALLVDMSGSMAGNRMKQARECAMLLCEVFSKNKNADLYIYGYSGQEITDSHAELYEFYTPKRPNKSSLVHMEAKYQNLDGYSLLQTRKYIRRQTSSDVLLFMLSDGAPAASGYSGRSAISHTRGCVKTLEKDNFKIVHIAIENSGLPEVYKNIVRLDDVSNLAQDLCLLVKRVLK